jgi:hypothetical protein
MLRSRRPSIIASVVTVAGCSLLAAGCGGTSSPAVATVSTTTNAAGASAAGTHASGLVAFASCMRSHGVLRFPDPDSSGGVPKPAVISAFQAVSKSLAEQAQTACNHLLPASGLSGQPVQTITAQDQKDYLEAAACMRRHGIANFPDPTFQNNGVKFNFPASIDPNSLQVRNALPICRKLIPTGLPYSGSS